jgi:hypothetical protein
MSKSPIEKATEAYCLGADTARLLENRPAGYRKQLAAIVRKAKRLGIVISADAFEPFDRKCVHCGCTDGNACPGGCSWAIIHKGANTGVCSQCVPKETKLVDAL